MAASCSCWRRFRSHRYRADWQTVYRLRAWRPREKNKRAEQASAANAEAGVRCAPPRGSRGGKALSTLVQQGADAAQCTLAGIELMHTPRKGQLKGGVKQGHTSAEQFYSPAAQFPARHGSLHHRSKICDTTSYVAAYLFSQTLYISSWTNIPVRWIRWITRFNVNLARHHSFDLSLR